MLTPAAPPPHWFNSTHSNDHPQYSLYKHTPSSTTHNGYPLGSMVGQTLSPYPPDNRLPETTTNFPEASPSPLAVLMCGSPPPLPRMQHLSESGHIFHLIKHLSYTIQEMNQFLDSHHSKHTGITAITTNCRNEMVAALSYYQTYIEGKSHSLQCLNNTKSPFDIEENEPPFLSPASLPPEQVQNGYIQSQQRPVIDEDTEYVEMDFDPNLQQVQQPTTTKPTQPPSKSSSNTLNVNAQQIALDVVGNVIGTPGPMTRDSSTGVVSAHSRMQTPDMIASAFSQKQSDQEHSSKLNAYAPTYQTVHTNVSNAQSTTNTKSKQPIATTFQPQQQIKPTHPNQNNQHIPSSHPAPPRPVYQAVAPQYGQKVKLPAVKRPMVTTRTAHIRPSPQNRSGHDTSHGDRTARSAQSALSAPDLMRKPAQNIQTSRPRSNPKTHQMLPIHPEHDHDENVPNNCNILTTHIADTDHTYHGDSSGTAGSNPFCGDSPNTNSITTNSNQSSSTQSVSPKRLRPSPSNDVNTTSVSIQPQRQTKVSSQKKKPQTLWSSIAKTLKKTATPSVHSVTTSTSTVTSSTTTTCTKYKPNKNNTTKTLKLNKVRHEEKSPEGSVTDSDFSQFNVNRQQSTNYWKNRQHSQHSTSAYPSSNSLSSSSYSSASSKDHHITPSPTPPKKLKQRKGGSEWKDSEVSSQGSRVFVSNLPPHVTDEDIRAVFGRCGEIANTVWFPSRTDGRFYGSGLITFCHHTGSENALRLNHRTVLGRIIRVEYSSCQDPVKVKPPGCRTIYLNNVPRDAQENRIRQVFKHCGKIKRVRFHERDGKRTGGAFVEFEQGASCDKALAFHGKIVDNHPLYVDYQRY